MGPYWDPSRLHDANDVVGYKLRTAHRFARRVIPVVLVPGSVPPLASLPSDFEWFTQLNAFIMPEPPEHRAYLVQLAELVTSTLAAEHQFIDWYCSEPRLAFNRIVVTRYRIFLEQAHYASSTINLRLAAVRRLAYEASAATGSFP